MPFVPPEQSFTLHERAFVLRRPGMGGLMRIPGHYAQVMGMAGMYPGYMETDMGAAARMRAIVSEYLTVCPDDWRVKKQPEAARLPVLDMDAIDPAEFLEVGRRAVDFHETFRELDAKFGASRSPE